MSKHICHIVKAFGNANQTYTKELIIALNKATKEYHYVYCHRHFGVANTIDVFTISDNSRFQFMRYFLSLFIRDSHFRSLFNQIHISILKKWVKLCAKPPHIIHLHHIHAIPYPVLAFLKTKSVKLIISLRGRDLLINSMYGEERKVLLKKLKLADKIHCISKYMHQYLKQNFNFNSEMIYRGQNGTDSLKIAPIPKKYNTIRIISVGRLEWVKGHIYSIESVYRLKNRGYNITLDIYGDGSLKEFLNFRIAQLDLRDQVHLKGYIDNTKLKTKYSDYAIALQTSLSEALSNGLIDLMMHNIPCVVTNVGGMPEVITHNANGVVVDVKHMEDLDNAIIVAKDLDLEYLKVYNDEHKLRFSRAQELRSLHVLYSQL